jgi:hypothetical protein
MTDLPRSLEQYITRDAIARVLDAAASRIERQHGNPVYMQAWRRAAKLIRAMDISEILAKH